jgi:hypothetical protein
VWSYVQPPRKVFFFEKKNQKTFICFGRHRVALSGSGTAGNSQKFFASFFQKRSPSFSTQLDTQSPRRGA